MKTINVTNLKDLLKVSNVLNQDVRKKIHYTLGLDIGDASIGWSMVLNDKTGQPFKILLADSIVFPVAEIPKNGKTKASARRAFRSGMRGRRRQQFRMHRARRLFINYGLLNKKQVKTAFDRSKTSLYRLRDAGLSKKLTNTQLFRVLYNYCKYRGFKSTRKYTQKANQSKPLLEAIQKSKAYMHRKGYQTYGQMLAEDKKFSHQKRNHDYNESYLQMPSRYLIVSEAKLILKRQSKWNPKVTPEFMKKYLQILTSQRNFDEGPANPSKYGGGINNLIGKDTFNSKLDVAAKATYTFELFRLLSNLNNLAYRSDDTKQYQYLTSEQRQKVVELAFRYQSLNYAQIKKHLKLGDVRFNKVNYGAYEVKARIKHKKAVKKINNLKTSNPKKAQKKALKLQQKEAKKSPDDKAESSSKICSMKTIKQIMARVPKKMRDDHQLLDKIGTILSLYKTDVVRIKHFKSELPQLPKTSIEKLIGINCSGFGNLSLDTMRHILPYLKKGYFYENAARKAGYNSSKIHISLRYLRNHITNPRVLRAFSITLKLVRFLEHYYGYPDAMVIECAGDLAKNSIERRQINNRQSKNATQNERIKDWLRDRDYPTTGLNIVKFKLFAQQRPNPNVQYCLDPYGLQKITADDVFNPLDNKVNIDHIIPQSISYDDSISNKILTTTKHNEDKGNQLPMQYVSNNVVVKNHLIKFAKHVIKNYRKRRHLLLNPRNHKQLAKLADIWQTSNLNDTRYITKLVANYFRDNGHFSQTARFGKQRVFVTKGAITAKLRSRWGIRKYYQHSRQRHFGYLNHAVDATVIACTNQSLIQRITTLNKYHEGSLHRISKDYHGHYGYEKNGLPLPWRDFTREVYARISSDPVKEMLGRPWAHYTDAEIKCLKPVRTVHLYSRKVNGPISKDTNYGATHLDEGQIRHRFPVNDLTLDKKGQLKKGSWRYPFKHETDVAPRLIARLKAFQTAKKAHPKAYRSKVPFPDGGFKYHDNTGHLKIVRRIKMAKPAAPGVMSKDGKSIRGNGKIVRIDIFSRHGRYEFVPVYAQDVIKPHLPDIVHCGRKARHLDKDDYYRFSLYPYMPVHLHAKRKFHLLPNKKVAGDDVKDIYTKDFYGYYRMTNVVGGGFDFQSFNGLYRIHNISLNSIAEFTKLNINYLGRLTRSHQHKRMPFHIKSLQ